MSEHGGWFKISEEEYFDGFALEHGDLQAMVAYFPMSESDPTPYGWNVVRDNGDGTATTFPTGCNGNEATLEEAKKKAEAALPALAARLTVARSCHS